MRILFLLLVPWLLFSDASIEQRIYREIFQALFPDRQTLRIWSDAKEKIARIRFEGKPAVRLVQNPENADILLIFHRTDVGSDRPVLIGRYSLLKVYGDRVVAGFYWKKGRPHLLFFDKGLRHYGIQLPRSFAGYLEKTR